MHTPVRGRNQQIPITPTRSSSTKSSHEPTSSRKSAPPTLTPAEVQSQSCPEFPSSYIEETQEALEYNEEVSNDILRHSFPQNTMSSNGREIDVMDVDNADVLESQTPIPASERHVVPGFDWDEFNSRFEVAMMDARAREDVLQDEFQDLVEYFKIWFEASAAHDHDRATKRVRTRVTHVQQSEGKLDAKREKYIKIVKAFEQAFELFRED